ncbi:MAG: hypothetical protein AB4426_04150 [Xenococcaceae cyanobacterium]
MNYRPVADDKPVDDTKPWYKSIGVLAASSVGVGILGYSVLAAINAQAVTHYILDDYSKSALPLVAERQEHCLASRHHYEPGDSRVEIQFADSPEAVSEEYIDNLTTSLPNCEGLEFPEADIGKVEGTSPSAALEYVLDLIEASRTKGDLNPVVITMILQEAEPGPDQPVLDEEGLARLKTLVQGISSEGGAISIIGPKGKLQRQLQSHLKTEPNVKICPFNGVADCVDWTFKKGRSLGKVKSQKSKVK